VRPAVFVGEGRAAGVAGACSSTPERTHRDQLAARQPIRAG
jgi:hypothetical protein